MESYGIMGSATFQNINAKDQGAISLSLEFFEKMRRLGVEMTEKHKPPYQFAQFGAELGLGTTS